MTLEEGRAILADSLPETDAARSWMVAYKTVSARYRWLIWRVNLIACSLVLAVSIPIALVLARYEIVSMQISVWFGILSVLVTSMAGRALLAAIPGFSWAQEFRSLHELLEPFRNSIESRQGGTAG
jgi:hypothetical protein